MTLKKKIVTPSLNFPYIIGKNSDPVIKFFPIWDNLVTLSLNLPYIVYGKFRHFLQYWRCKTSSLNLCREGIPIKGRLPVKRMCEHSATLQFVSQLAREGDRCGDVSTELWSESNYNASLCASKSSLLFWSHY